MRYDLVDAEYPLEPDPAFRRRAAWILSRMDAHDGRSLPELDVGCGRGFYLPLYARLGATSAGVESDRQALEIARLLAAQHGAVVRQANAEELPFASASFDVVVLSEILEHLSEPRRALQEAARVLREGGLLLVTVPNANYPFFWDPINWIRERVGLGPVRHGLFAGIWANHLRLYTSQALRDEVATAGFQICELVRQTRLSLPFMHNVIYGFGRTGLEKGLIPTRWLRKGLRGANEFNHKASHHLRVGPVDVGIRLARLIDRLNSDEEPARASSVNLCLRARKSQN